MRDLPQVTEVSIMPVQQQMSSFAKRLGGRVSQANAECAGKPIELGRKQLPPNIRKGIAKLSTMYTKEQTEESGVCPKGETFFRASAIVVVPEECAGAVTQIIIPLCDMPGKKGDGYEKKAVSFAENWNKFRSLFEALGVAQCPETPQTDPTGQRTEAYFMAAMKMLVDPQRTKTNPIYIEFNTRGFTPKATPQKPNPSEIVMENWVGQAQPEDVARLFGGNGQPNPAGGVTEGAPPMHPPTVSANGAAPSTKPTPPTQPETEEDPADVVASLVEIAMNDPNGETEEGQAAGQQLEEMAWANGWTKKDTKDAADWSAVGDMALNPPEESPDAGDEQQDEPTVGSKWMFCKRDKSGAKLKNAKTGVEFAAQEVEITAIDEANGTCHVKTVKDGKDVVDLRTKKPIDVKLEWLEPNTLY